jgi:hypothetical protein
MLQVDASNNAMHLSRRLMIFLELPGSLRPGDGKRSVLSAHFALSYAEAWCTLPKLTS